MAKLELRTARNALLEEKQKLDQTMTTVQDEYNMLGEKLQKHRRAQMEYREGLESLSNSNSSKPARKVFNDKISEHQLEIDKILKELDAVELKRTVASQKLKAMQKSINELQNA